MIVKGFLYRSSSFSLWISVLNLSPPIPLRLYTLPYSSNPPFLFFWHSSALALTTERQSAGMSKIKNDELDQYGAGPSNSSNLEQLALKGLINFSVCNLAIGFLLVSLITAVLMNVPGIFNTMCVFCQDLWSSASCWWASSDSRFQQVSRCSKVK